MAMVAAFFSLNSSMLTNISEQTKEVGILRAVGLTKAAIFRLYIYEAFILIIGASLLGVRHFRMWRTITSRWRLDQ
jgi:ABC-type antimicrobial peptide transport system permease subunit